MKIFVTGASGFLGGSIAARLVSVGHDVEGLVRSEERSRNILDLGLTPVVGTLEDLDLLAHAAERADAVINAADSDNRAAVHAFIAAMAGSEKAFIHTSGSSIVSDDAQGEYASPKVFDDDSFVQPIPSKRERYAIDQAVRVAGIEQGIRTIVICPTMVYGTGRGWQKNSNQVPRLLQRALEKRAGVFVGKGLNRWSNVYIDDLIDLYVLALEKAPTGSFFFAENGESSFLELASFMSRSHGLEGKVESWPLEDAEAEYGRWARTALASNSRVRAKNARALLGWSPHGPSIQSVIEHGDFAA